MKYFFVAALCVLFGFQGVNAQQVYNKAYLQNQNKQLEKEIESLSKTLTEVSKKTTTSLVFLTTLKQKVETRAKLVSNTNKEKRFLDDEIYLTKLEINKLNRELEDLRQDYKEVLIRAYKNISVQNKILFVLKSKDFTQAFKRVKYLQMYADYQDNKAEDIHKKIKEIEKLKNAKEASIRDLERLLVTQRQQLNQLDQEKILQQKSVQQYKAQQGDIRAQIRNKQKQYDKIEAQIQKIIQEEIEKQERLAREKEREAQRLRDIAAAKEKRRLDSLAALGKPNQAPPKPKVQPKPVEVKSEAVALGDSFAANQGKLPWPSSSSNIISAFGKHPHPLFPELLVDNSGIDIACTSDKKIKSTFKGRVSRIMQTEGLYTIMVSHGTYFTAYSNLNDIYVKQGDEINTGQVIGNVYTDTNGDAILKFVIYNNKGQKLNPQSWLR